MNNQKIKFVEKLKTIAIIIMAILLVVTISINGNNISKTTNEVLNNKNEYNESNSNADVQAVVNYLIDVNNSNNIFLMAYPIGSIYTSITNTNPGTIFGGTWIAFGTGRTLVGVDTNDASFDTVEETGGEKAHTLTVSELPSHNHSYTKATGVGNHTLTVSEMPSHSHTFNRHAGTDDSNWSGHIANAVQANDTTPVLDSVTTSSSGGGGAHNHPLNTASDNTGSTGSGSAHNNLQPYITVYMWKRTA